MYDILFTVHVVKCIKVIITDHIIIDVELMLYYISINVSNPLHNLCYHSFYCFSYNRVADPPLAGSSKIEFMANGKCVEIILHSYGVYE